MQGFDFEGGDLYFKGKRCRVHQRTHIEENEHYVYKHIPGRALIHLGQHRHGAMSISGGHRMNLIVWCRSSTFRNNYLDSCHTWCGTYDPRKDKRLPLEQRIAMGPSAPLKTDSPFEEEKADQEALMLNEEPKRDVDMDGAPSNSPSQSGPDEPMEEPEVKDSPEP